MDKARSSFSIDNGVWRCWREGALIFCLCARRLWKIGEVKGRA